jgi:hypothetical protein
VYTNKNWIKSFQWAIIIPTKELLFLIMEFQGYKHYNTDAPACMFKNNFLYGDTIPNLIMNGNKNIFLCLILFQNTFKK